MSWEALLGAAMATIIAYVVGFVTGRLSGDDEAAVGKARCQMCGEEFPATTRRLAEHTSLHARRGEPM